MAVQTKGLEGLVMHGDVFLDGGIEFRDGCGTRHDADGQW